ncbi:uncharacterized protein [Hyperolius riggenbachi]|uniref:uncharacterized protein isoform X2 n=1 Tax=Hyperolius riggenbachi TaxID=752182 RepID=UPI0035A2FD51
MGPSLRVTWLMCVLLALLVTGGDTLQCISCTNTSGKDCTGNSVICQYGYDVCMSSLVQYQIDSSYPGGVSNFPTRVFMRSCGNSEQCSDLTVLRTPYIRMVTSNKCCSGGNCSPQPPTGSVTMAGCATRSACNLYLGSDNAKTECYGESPPNSSSVLPVLPVLLVIAALLSISL